MEQQSAYATVPVGDEIGQRAIARVRRRLIPFMFLLYIVAYLDRINIGFAALQMNRDLGFGPAVYGFGAGVFFIGYFLLEVPSNLALMINSIGNLGGFAGPYLVGLMKDATGSTDGGLVALAVILAFGALLATRVTHVRETEEAPERRTGRFTRETGEAPREAVTDSSSTM
jgi:cyanate permease